MSIDYESTSRFIDVDGRQMHYHEAGSGPTLVFLHGGGPGVSSWSNFKYNLPSLSQRFRCIAIDQPGFGRSHQAAPTSASSIRVCRRD